MLKRYPLYFIQFCVNKLFVIFCSFFGQWSLKKKCFWDLLTFTYIVRQQFKLCTTTKKKEINNFVLWIVVAPKASSCCDYSRKYGGISFFRVKNRWKGLGLSNIEFLFRTSRNTLKDLSFHFSFVFKDLNTTTTSLHAVSIGVLVGNLSKPRICDCTRFDCRHKLKNKWKGIKLDTYLSRNCLKPW